MQRPQLHVATAALCLTWLSVSATSRADISVAACAEAYGKGQEERLAGRLLSARQEFAVCASTLCPLAVFPDCKRWAKEVEAALVTISPEARDDAGEEIPSLSLLVDGVRVAPEELIAPISLEAGHHVVRFEAQGYEPIEVEKYLRSGDRAVAIRAVMSRTKHRAEPPPQSQEPGTIAPASAFPVAALSFAGVGLLMLGGATYFGVSAANRYDDLQSTCAPGCPRRESDAVHRRALASDLLLIASATALGGAAWLYFGATPDRPGGATAVGVRAAPAGAQLELRLKL